MKSLVILCGAALLCGLPARAQEGTALTQVPDRVREAIDREAQGEPVRRITRQTIEGRTTYLVEIERDNALNPQFRFSEDGEQLPTTARLGDTSPLALDPGIPAPVTYDSVVTLSDVPEPVRETVQREAGGREIADIDRETWEGRNVYEVEFRAEGRNPQIHVAEDGTLVRGEQERRGIRELLMGTRLADTPAAVQATIQREAAGREVEDIDVERRTGQIIYEVKIADPRTGSYKLHVDANGQLVKDSRAEAPNPQP